MVVGGGVLVASFVAIAARTGNPWPWSETVHETGARTLAGTILYYEHAARELPLDIVLGIAIGGSLLLLVPPAPRGALRAPLVGGACVAGGLMALILAGTWFEGGARALADNLFQHHTRPEFGLEWGSHWRYHLLSRLALILASLGLAGLLIAWTRGAPRRARQAGLVTVAASLLLFVLGTIVFTPSVAAFWLPFRDPIYLGHQARELFTHLLVTLPLGWGIGLLLLSGARVQEADRTDPDDRPSWLLVAGTIAAGGLAAATGLYVVVAAMLNDAASQGQTQDVAMLIFPHFFEHTFSYGVVPAVAAVTYAAVGLIALGPDREPGRPARDPGSENEAAGM